jgi:hypothetical protein
MNMNYVSPAEQEHLDHVAGSASEFQNCFSEANDVRRQLHHNGQVEIAALLAAGRFVVVEENPYHCRATDAVAGMVASPVGHFASREEAEAFAAPRAEVQERYGDGFVYVLPRCPGLPQSAHRAVAVEDDCPF